MGEKVKGTYDPSTFQRIEIDRAIVRKSFKFYAFANNCPMRFKLLADFELDGICNYICRLQSAWKLEEFS